MLTLILNWAQAHLVSIVLLFVLFADMPGTPAAAPVAAPSPTRKPCGGMRSSRRQMIFSGVVLVAIGFGLLIPFEIVTRGRAAVLFSALLPLLMGGALLAYACVRAPKAA